MFMILEFIACLFMAFFAVRISVSLGRQRAVFDAHAVPGWQVRFLQVGVLLYVLSLFIAMTPAAMLPAFALILAGFLLLAPGLVLGRRLAVRMDVGHDAAVRASQAASAAFWLGIAVILFLATNLVVFFGMGQLGNSGIFG